MSSYSSNGISNGQRGGNANQSNSTPTNMMRTHNSAGANNGGNYAPTTTAYHSGSALNQRSLSSFGNQQQQLYQQQQQQLQQQQQQQSQMSVKGPVIMKNVEKANGMNMTQVSSHVSRFFVLFIFVFVCF